MLYMYKLLNLYNNLIVGCCTDLRVYTYWPISDEEKVRFRQIKMWLEIGLAELHNQACLALQPYS